MREWLIQLRKSKQLTQQQVASRCFIERSYYSQIERGKRNPSTHVAKIIGEVLGFNPLKFFKNDLDFSFNEYKKLSSEKKSHENMLDYIKYLEYGRIVYLYNSIQKYYKHLFTYLLIGIKDKRHCIIIDNNKNYCLLKKRLESVYTNKEIENFVHHINIDISNHDVESVIQNVQYLLAKLNDNECIYFWIHKEKMWQNSLWEKLDETDINYIKVLAVQAFNASLISGGEHIKLMKKYPLLMTDEEIVTSPFFNSNPNSLILPSLFIQENI